MITDREVLLGASNSGKSTLMNQMSIILAEDSIADQDRKAARQIIFCNLKAALRRIEEVMKKRGLDYQHQQSHVQA